jgi:hypothetical protein
LGIKDDVVETLYQMGRIAGEYLRIPTDIFVQKVRKYTPFVSVANNIEDENEKAQEIQRINDMIDRSINVKKDYREKQSERGVAEDFIKDIHDQESSSYKVFIDLVDQLLEGVTLIKQKQLYHKQVKLQLLGITQKGRQQLL